MSYDDKSDGDAIIEDVHEQQREMALGVVGAVSKMAKATGNDPVLFAMQRAHDVLEPVPPPPGAERNRWLNDLLARLAERDSVRRTEPAR